MGDDRTLLSQEEVDALLTFILRNSADVVASEVMDQKSIDKLVKALQGSGGDKAAYENQPVTLKSVFASAYPMIVLKDEANVEKPELLVLEYRKEDSGVKIFCRHIVTEKTYEITPGMLDGMRYIIDDEATWGNFIPPVTFDRLALILKVRYTRETFTAVCKDFAKALYGNEDTLLPDIYMPMAKCVMEHMVEL